jgi:hypothetical protein
VGGKGQSLIARFLTGKGFTISAVLTAVIAAVVPQAVTYFKDRFSSSTVQITAEEHFEDDPMTLPETLISEQVANLTDADFMTRPVSGSATKAELRSITLVIRGNISHRATITNITNLRTRPLSLL